MNRALASVEQCTGKVTCFLAPFEQNDLMGDAGKILWLKMPTWAHSTCGLGPEQEKGISRSRHAAKESVALQQSRTTGGVFMVVGALASLPLVNSYMLVGFRLLVCASQTRTVGLRGVAPRVPEEATTVVAVTCVLAAERRRHCRCHEAGLNTGVTFLMRKWMNRIRQQLTVPAVQKGFRYVISYGGSTCYRVISWPESLIFEAFARAFGLREVLLESAVFVRRGGTASCCSALQRHAEAVSLGWTCEYMEDRAAVSRFERR
jgi:hypothetical protein